MDGRPIGVFDSGVGGLTVLREIARRMPRERLIYLGDTARLPYGTKSRETVVKYSLNNAAFLVERGVKCLVIACNTASSLALVELRRRFSMPVIGVVSAGARRAAAATRRRRVAVIGTDATIRSGAYPRAIECYRRGVKVLSVPCPLFVALAEEGWTSGEIPAGIAEHYLGGLRDEGIDVLVLGCTHYPLLKPVISRTLGEGVLLVDSGEEVARELAASLREGGLAAEGEKDSRGSSPEIYLTDRSPGFLALGERIMEMPLRNVEHVEIG